MTRARWLRVAKGTAFLVLVAAAVLWAVGGFHGDRVGPGHTPALRDLPAPAYTVVVRRETVPVVEEAVGTVGSRRRVVVAAQVTGRIVRIAAEVAERVRRGTPLVVLEDTEMRARFAQARAHYARTKGFLAQRAATKAELEAAEAEYLQAKAAVAHTTVRAPIDGVVAEREVEPGDLAWPGRSLLVVLDAGALRLEAQVREGVIGHVRTGARLDVVLPAAGRTMTGTVTEVLPSADPRTRTFTVRVDLEHADGVHPGMFGRLRLPIGEREVVRLPAGSLERVGQLETVLVRDDDRWTRRLITTGRAFEDGSLEVLSGLAGGETVGLQDRDD